MLDKEAALIKFSSDLLSAADSGEGSALIPQISALPVTL